MASHHDSSSKPANDENAIMRFIHAHTKEIRIVGYVILALVVLLVLLQVYSSVTGK